MVKLGIVVVGSRAELVDVSHLDSSAVVLEDFAVDLSFNLGDTKTMINSPVYSFLVELRQISCWRCDLYFAPQGWIRFERHSKDGSSLNVILTMDQV